MARLRAFNRATETTIRLFLMLAVATTLLIGSMPALYPLRAIAHENHDRTPDVRMPLMLSPELSHGQKTFNANCASCHGKQLEGSKKGPSLIPYDRVHHPDGAFATAMKSGVKQHHWAFGDMPPVAKLTDHDIQAIINYVREVQDFNTDNEIDR